MDNDDFLDKEIEYANTLCRKAYGLSPDIRFQCENHNTYIYGDDENTVTGVLPDSKPIILWTITGERRFPTVGPNGATLAIKVGPYKSLLRCVCEWNQSILKLTGTTFTSDLFNRDNK